VTALTTPSFTHHPSLKRREAAKFVRDEIDDWGKLVRAAGIQPE
jgi:tripartite-type tricarboxylate transporter receptor subunit TctC